MIVALAVFAVLGFGLVVGVALAVSWLRARRTWRGPGLIMHELICPMGELQDPQYLDRRRAVTSARSTLSCRPRRPSGWGSRRSPTGRRCQCHPTSTAGATADGSLTDTAPWQGPPRCGCEAGDVTLRRAALAGLLAGAFDIAAGELFAAVLQWAGIKGTGSPVLAIGSAFVDRTPPWLKDFATNTFGTADKKVLLAGMAVVLAPPVGRHRDPDRQTAAGWGCSRSSAFGAVAGVAALTRPASGGLDVLPAILGAFAGMGVLMALLDRAAEPDTQTRTRDLTGGRSCGPAC